jgi:hypothetical protein
MLVVPVLRVYCLLDQDSLKSVPFYNYASVIDIQVSAAWASKRLIDLLAKIMQPKQSCVEYIICGEEKEVEFVDQMGC